MTVESLRAPAARRIISTFSTWVDGKGSLRHLELLRMAAGVLVIAHLRPFLADALAGVTYLDRFYEPYAQWYPEAPRETYLALLWLAVPSAVALSAGFLTRWSSTYSAAFVGYNLFLSRTHFGHNRAFLLVLLIGLALLPLGRALSADAAIRSRRDQEALPPVGPLWPVLLMRIEVVVVYFGSGFSKLLDADWFGGTVTRLRVVQWSDAAASRGIPDWVLDVLATDGFHVVFAKLVIVTELAIALGLAVRKTRPGAMWLAVWFHVAIEITASVQVFSYAGIAALVIWVAPSRGRRVITVDTRTATGRTVRRLIVALDWTRRFEVEEVAVPESHAGVALRNADAGSRCSGPAALLLVGTRLPLLFPFIAPFNLRLLRPVWERGTERLFTGTSAPTR